MQARRSDTRRRFCTSGRLRGGAPVSPVSPLQVLEERDIARPLGDDLLELRVLLLERLQTVGPLARSPQSHKLSRARATDPLPIRVEKRIVPHALRFRFRLALTAVLAPRERLRAREILSRSSLKLHTGSHRVRKEGWVKVDLAGIPVDLAWNLAQPLSFPNKSVEAIFHEHLLEHMTLEVGLRMIDECYRTLRPGGVLRVVVPDATDLVVAYAESRGGPYGRCPTAFLVCKSRSTGTDTERCMTPRR